MRMRRNLFAILIGFSAVLLLLALFETTSPKVQAVQPVYGGIISQKYVNTSQVLGVELTWLGFSAQTVVVNVRYQLQCENGNVIAFPGNQAFFNATAAFTAGFGQFGGTGLYFPCNGWLQWSLVLVTTPLHLPAGYLELQLEILDTMPNGWSPAIPGGTQLIGQAFLNNIIEDVLFSGSLTSNYAISWPSASGYPMTNPSYETGAWINLAISNPAAGSNWQQGLGLNGQQYGVYNVTYTLATNATAGNRFACVEFLTGGISGTVVGGPYCSPYAQQPSQTVTYNFSAGTGWATNCSFIGSTQTAVKCPVIVVPLPAVWSDTSDINNFAIDAFVSSEVSAQTNGLQAGDIETGITIHMNVKHQSD